MKSLTEIFAPFKSDNLLEWFDDLVLLWHETGPIEPEDRYTPKGMVQWVHYHNFQLWHHEDQARRHDLPAEELISHKRAIDRHNQARNDGIEQIDVWIENVLVTSGIEPNRETEMNSETPGSICDRLSILSLKIYHTDEQKTRPDVEKNHIKICKDRLAILHEQRKDLGHALDRLILDLRQAKKRHKIYRQFKMYNDPRFNSFLAKQNDRSSR